MELWLILVGYNISNKTMINETQLLKGDLATLNHIHDVRKNLFIFIDDLLKRSLAHDASKLESPEREIFAEKLDSLGKCEYGSLEYKKTLEDVRPAIEHHYSKNDHHTEHFPNGINDMTLIQLLELLADWKAATKRNKAGNILKSIEYNSKKYDISPQLTKILENTVKKYFE